MRTMVLAVLAVLFIWALPRAAQAQADLIIATNAEITFPSCTEDLTHYYFFTVVDDGGGLGTPEITNLGYDFTGPNQIDLYDNGEFTYATFEMVVSIPSPNLGTQENDCFTITYEGESVNPCFDVAKANAEVCGGENEAVAACVNLENGMVRIVLDEVNCRESEYRTALLLPPAEPAAQTAAAPASPRRE